MARRQGALYVEVNSDEDWEEMLKRDGLLVVDIYSDCFGPCLGMTPILKKVKLEVAGDLMVWVIAKSDNIAALERFRDKSEPTWMFISRGKMVNLMFGCSAPALNQLLLDEVAKERHAEDTHTFRPERAPISELHSNELDRWETKQRETKLALEKEEIKRVKNIRDRKVRECKNIAKNLNLGVILIFPCAVNKFQDFINECLKDYKCSLYATEKVQLTIDLLEEMFYFYDKEEPPFDEYSLNSLLNEPCIMCCIKSGRGKEPINWEIVMGKVLYGAEGAPPGDRFGLYRKTLIEEENEETGEVQLRPGCWVTNIACIRATMLRMFFPKYAKDLAIPDPGPTPPHFAVIFDTKKIKDALHIIGFHPKHILHYGFFTKGDPEDTELVAKSVQRLEMPAYRSKRTYQEKLVLAVSKKKSQLMLDLINLGPMYMSPTSDEGALDTDKFFPIDYADSLPDDERAYIEHVDEVEEEGGEVEEAA